jgi:hypothetical protein
MNPKISSMAGVDGEKVSLTGVNIRAQLQDLLAQVEMEQSYRNDETSNIEAVYTFALSLDAVLLELEVQLGDRLLKGEVTAKSEAEELILTPSRPNSMVWCQPCPCPGKAHCSSTLGVYTVSR